MGVKLGKNPRRKKFLRAKKAVISNASLWDTQKLLPNDAISQKWSKEAKATNMTGSFMHLHLGKEYLSGFICMVQNPCMPLSGLLLWRFFMHLSSPYLQHH